MKMRILFIRFSVFWLVKRTQIVSELVSFSMHTEGCGWLILWFYSWGTLYKPIFKRRKAAYFLFLLVLFFFVFLSCLESNHKQWSWISQRPFYAFHDASWHKKLIWKKKTFTFSLVAAKGGIVNSCIVCSEVWCWQGAV